MAVFVYSSLCSLISETLFLSERNTFAANRLDSQGFYCSFIFCRVPSLQHLWWPLSGHVSFLFLSHLPFVSFRCFPLSSKWVFSITYLDVVSVSKRQLTLGNVIHLELNSIFLLRIQLNFLSTSFSTFHYVPPSSDVIFDFHNVTF